MSRTPVIELLDDEMVALLRRKTSAEKLAAAHAMWSYARRRLIATLHHEHPDWDETQIRQEIRRRTIGTT